MTTVVLADDEALLRKALAALLPLEGDVTVLAEAADGAEAVRETLLNRPDVLVIDLEMPGTDGLAAVAEIRAARHGYVDRLLVIRRGRVAYDRR